MAELKIVSREPGAISFNYEEIKAEITEKAEEYAVAVYSSENIGAAKADRARLNKLKTMLNDERIKREKEFMKPFEEFKSQVADLVKIIEKPIAAIDKQVKAFEKAERLDKKGDCVEIFASITHPDWLDYTQIENPKWYNKTTSLASVKEEIQGILNKIDNELGMIMNFCPNSAIGIENYKRTLDVQKSLEIGKMAAEAQKKEEEKLPLPFAPDEDDEEEYPEWVSFRAYLTTKTAKMLASWMKLNGIKFEKGE